MEKLDEAETDAAEAMIRFSASLMKHGFDERAKEVTRTAMKMIRERHFFDAVKRCQ